jgi:RHS repeat-associated protein
VVDDSQLALRLHRQRNHRYIFIYIDAANRPEGLGQGQRNQADDKIYRSSTPRSQATVTFTSATQADMYTAVGDTSPSTGCSSCQHSQELLDGWGRATSSIFVNNPIGQVNLDSTYDDAGQLASQSHPYSGTSDPNHVFETSGYDALGRQISIAHPDSQLVQAAFGAMIGGLGGVTAQQGSVSTYGYGYPQISEDESGHQHQGWTDGFGRIIEADEPSTSTSTLATTTVSVSAGSGGQSQIVDPCQACKQFGCPPCPYTQWNSGVVSLTVGGYTANAPYGPSGSTYDTTSQVAAELTATFNSDSNSPVTASGTGASIILTSKGPGASGNLAVSSSETWYTSTCGTTSPCFLGPAFVVSPSSGSLSGGSGGIDSSPLYTNYTYDAADHLTNVVQGVQTRTFAYDGLGRKITETTPEAGTVTYSYTTSGGALCSGDASSACRRTDARGVISTYSYDAANRLAGITYTIPGGKNIAAMPNVCTTTPSGSSANVCYHYDQGGATAHAIGRLTNMTDPTGSETTTYYVDGNVKQISKVISGQTYNLGYQYDAGGDVTQITYPSGRVVYQAYNSIGQLCLVSPSSSGCSGTSNYAGSFSYNAPGNLTGFSYGNGVSAAFSYSAPRAQLSSLKYTFGTQTYFNLGYWYQKDSTNCLNGATQNNGAIQCITDSADSGRTVNYAYDALGRMITAKTNGSSGYPQWGLSESYDRYGNRWTQALTAGSGPSVSLTFGASGMGSSTTNQPSGYTFDASGNMTVEPLSPPNNMTYDGENRMTAFSGNGGGASYTYDGNGLRVVKAVSGGTTTVSVLAGSSVIAEYDNGVAPTAPSREYIYNPAGGATTGLLAMISAGATTYYHQDHLSARLTTNASGSILSQDGSFPFGESWYTSGTGNQWFFTSYDRDSESGLDYALARYYDSRTGTFCSADPLAGSPDDPQSWNRYPYGRNDPIAITDPSGKALWSDILELGISIAAAVFAPEIDTFLGGLFPESDAAFAAEPAAHAGGTFAGLITRGATTAATVADGAGDAAAAATSGYAGLGAAAALATDHPKKPSKLCNDANAVNFVKSHQADASSVAKQLGVPTENVLGLSAHESTWGTGPFISRNGLGDAFFSEEGGTQPALSNGVMHPTEDLGKSVWSFPTYLASAQAFAARYGKYVKGVTDPSQFSGNLLKKHFNTGTKAGNGTPGWSGQVVRDIANTATRMKCP